MKLIKRQIQTVEIPPSVTFRGGSITKNENSRDFSFNLDAAWPSKHPWHGLFRVEHLIELRDAIEALLKETGDIPTGATDGK